MHKVFLHPLIKFVRDVPDTLILELPVEIISYILSFLPQTVLAATSCVTHFFSHESEFYLYRHVCIQRESQLRIFMQATATSHRRRLLLQSFDCSALIPFATLVTILKCGFRNLTYLSYLPGIHPPLCDFVVPAMTPHKKVPEIDALKLKHLKCSPDIDKDFVSFLKSQPAITSLNIVSESISYLPPSDILPVLEELSCSARDLSMFTCRRPIRKIKIIGGVEPYDFVEYILPDLTRLITPLAALNITLLGITRRTLDRLVDSLPCLEDLVVSDDLGLLPRKCHAAIDVRQEDLPLASYSCMATHNLTLVFFPLSRLRHLRRFAFLTVSDVKQCDIRHVFHWRDASASLHTLVLQNEALTRKASHREWGLESLGDSC